MVLLGVWLAVIGYGLVYAGVFKASGPGAKCSIGQAFRGQCSGFGSNQTASLTTGQTSAQTQAQADASQVNNLPATSNGLTTPLSV